MSQSRRKTIYFVRHGQTKGNKADLHQPLDMPLDIEGVDQIVRTAKKLGDYRPEIIYTNDHKYRLFHTGVVLQDSLGIPLIHTEDLKEQSKPSVLHGRSKDDPLVQEFKNSVAQNTDDPNWHFGDEDNVHERVGRIVDFLSDVREQKESTVVATVTSGFLRSLRYVVEVGSKVDVTKHRAYDAMRDTDNAALSIVTETEDGWWRIESWNDTAHLKR